MPVWVLLRLLAHETIQEKHTTLLGSRGMPSYPSFRFLCPTACRDSSGSVVHVTVSDQYMKAPRFNPQLNSYKFSFLSHTKLCSSYIYIYSGTPLFWTSEMRTSCFNGHFTPVWINPGNADTLLFRIFSSFSTWIMWSLACLSRMVVCHCWSIQQLDITIAMVCTFPWSAFLASTQQGRALERTFVTLYSMGMHYYAYQKHTRSLQNTDASITWTRSGVPMMSAIEGFHCICVCMCLSCSLHVANIHSLSCQWMSSHVDE